MIDGPVQHLMLQATLNEETLVRFLQAFYVRVRRDALNGPVFAEAIPDAAWTHHMATITAFWSSVLLKTGSYKGNPFAKHARLGVLQPEHFARWLDLFEQTATAQFTPDVARSIVERAHRIGDSLKAGLFFRPGVPT